ncbi:MAG: hypothetical protein HKP58_14130 [Desulfatitalea sp.]|nr:hypothetical protein [Desulfatitalea sp.]NNK01542.1 hypothetical protein [Desulfatitalea sp.]
MKKITIKTVFMMFGSILLLLIEAPVTLAVETEDRCWHFNLNLAYGSRILNGELIKKNALTDNIFGSLMTTGDAMNVGTSYSPMVAVGAQYKRWGVSLNYMPTAFNGLGSAIVDLGGSSTGIRAQTALNTDINIRMLLGNVYYNLIQTPHSMFGIGAGLGQTAIDLEIIPAIGDALIYKGDQPFGFLSLYMSNTYKQFIYGFNLNGISATFDGAKVDFSDYKVTLGYRVLNSQVKCDIIGGYRMVNFAMDLESGRNVLNTDVTLEGPFMGVNLIY